MLPKISRPNYNIILPSTKKTMIICPMTIAEEKMLMMAVESTDDADKLTAVQNIMNLCVVSSEKIDFDKISYVDFEFLFAKIRAISVDNIVNIIVDDNISASYNINEFKIRNIDEYEAARKVRINDDTTIILGYPSLYSVRRYIEQVKNTSRDDVSLLISLNVEMIVIGDDVYDSKTLSEEELYEYVDMLPANCLKQISDAFDLAPYLYFVAKTKSKDGTSEDIEIRGLSDFF